MIGRWSKRRRGVWGAAMAHETSGLRLLDRLFPSPAPLPPGIGRVYRAREMVVTPRGPAVSVYAVAPSTLDLILDDVRVHGPTTCTRVASRLGLSHATVSSGFRALQATGELMQKGKESQARLWQLADEDGEVSDAA